MIKRVRGRLLEFLPPAYASAENQGALIGGNYNEAVFIIGAYDVLMDA